MAEISPEIVRNLNRNLENIITLTRNLRAGYVTLIKRLPDWADQAAYAEISAAKVEQMMKGLNRDMVEALKDVADSGEAADVLEDRLGTIVQLMFYFVYLADNSLDDVNAVLRGYGYELRKVKKAGYED